MRNASIKTLVQLLGMWSLLAVPTWGFGNSDLRSVIGVYEGKIESIEMVPATT